MGSVNKVILVGNLGRDAECATRRAAPRSRRSTWRRPRSGTTRPASVRRKPSGTASCCGASRPSRSTEYLTKGKQIYVEGRLQTRQWDDKDGNKRYTTEIRGDRIVLLGGGGGGGGAADGSRRRRDGRPRGAGPESSEPLTDDDIPF